MMVIEMRQCVRCGSSFRPFDADQMCCSDGCSTALHTRSLLPAIADRRTLPRQEMAPVINHRPRGRRGPVFIGGRFVVFDWQIEQLARLLGPHLDQFDLEEWFFALDAQMATSPEIIPQRDGGQWLQARTLDEARRRGLTVASSEDPAMGKQTSRLAQAIANIKGGFTS